MLEVRLFQVGDGLDLPKEQRQSFFKNKRHYDEILYALKCNNMDD